METSGGCDERGAAEVSTEARERAKSVHGRGFARVCNSFAVHTSLPVDGRTTRVRHTLTCFLGRHHYRWTDARHGHDEYVCVRCGHPLLFASEANP
jgi:hypothetical protein